jgi:hypothetical protein
MSAAFRTQPWFIGALTALAAIPLAFSFAWREVLTAAHHHPWHLSVLFLLGALLAVLGAEVPRRLGLRRLALASRTAEVGVGLGAGLCIGAIAGVAGWFAASHTLWALLVWFLFGSIATAAYGILLGRRDG